MLPLIAVPLIHSSGAWIASTAASGYVAGTLSSTWIGAFIAGNAGLLTGLGVTSAAGAMAALGGGLSSVGASVGAGLTAVGLGGLAKSVGLAPATFLGLTVAGWTAAAASVVLVGAGYFFQRAKLSEINERRAEGGLAEISWTGILSEAREFEREALKKILRDLAADNPRIRNFTDDTVEINGVVYKLADLEYVIEKSGRQYIGERSMIPFNTKVIFIVKPADPEK